MAEGWLGPPAERAAPVALRRRRSFTPAERGPGVTTGQQARRPGMRCPVPRPVAPPSLAAAKRVRRRGAGARGSLPAVPLLRPPSHRNGAGHSACGSLSSTFPELALLQLNPNSNKSQFSSVLPTTATPKQKSLSVGKCGLEHEDARKSPILVSPSWL